MTTASANTNIAIPTAFVHPTFYVVVVVMVAALIDVICKSNTSAIICFNMTCLAKIPAQFHINGLFRFSWVNDLCNQ